MAGKTVVAKLVFNRFPELSAELRSRAKDVVVKATRDAEAAVKQSMNEPKTGLMYGGHQASAPGEAPAIDTGNLVNSIQVEFQNNYETGIVYTNAEYAEALEYGGAHVAARPFMEPAAQKILPAFRSAMEQLLAQLK